MTASRQLPHNLADEEMLLSVAMLDGVDVLPKACAAGVTAASFYDSKHGIIYEALLALLRAGESTEVDMVASHLAKTKQLDQVGGYAFITQVSSRVPTTAQAPYFIERVREQATLRALITTAAKVVEECHAFAGGDAQDLVQRAVADILDLGAANCSKRLSWKAAVGSARSRLERQVDPEITNKPDLDSVSFGFSDLDRCFAPMRPGQLVVLAARPSVGKSSLARQIAHHAAFRAKHQVVFGSLEMIGDSLARSMAQTVSGVSARTLNPQSHPRDVADFRHAMDSLVDPYFDVLAATNVTLEAIRARVLLLRAKGTPAKLVVIDYIGLLPEGRPAKGETRAASLGRVSRALKALALDEGCVVLALSQLNRESARDGREPALYDLRDSGEIEQDADKVILLHRPPENPITILPQPETSLPSDVPTFYVNAIQAKGRDDGTGIVGLSFRRAIARFEQIAT
jgi:replicative DNA helicase